MSNTAEMTSNSDSDLGGRRVLIADETARERWAYVGLLRQAGARVTEARDAHEALELARLEHPDLILAGADLPSIDGLTLSDVLLSEPRLSRIPVMLTKTGLSPELARPPAGEAGPVVSAFLAALSARQTSENDPVEREDLRAQSMVAMHRDPANRVAHPADVAWRLRTSAMPSADGSVSGFGAELQVVSRIFGAGLITLILATVAVIVWRLTISAGLVGPAGPVSTPGAELEAETATEAVAGEQRAGRSSEPERGLTAFSGQLSPGVDLDIGASAEQGALVLEGDPSIRVTVDGVDRGALPVSIVLDEGRHIVRYRSPDGFTDRFYFVKAGATRTLRAITQPGGFVDAR